MNEARTPITLLIVDDQPLLRAGIAAMLSGYADIELVGEAGCSHNAVARFRDVQPDVTLMMVQTPTIKSINAVKMIASEFPQAKIAVLCGSKDPRVRAAVKASAHAYVLSDLHNELASRVRELAAGRQYVPTDVDVDLSTEMNPNSLSSREQQVLHWVAQGRSNREVAQLLMISETTVNSHLQNVMRKLGVHNRTHAVTVGLQRGVIQARR